MHNMSPLIRIGLRLSVNRHLQLLTMTGLKINIHILLLRESQLPGQASAAAMPLIIIFILTGTVNMPSVTCGSPVSSGINIAP